MVAMLAATAMPAFALPGGIANDDKNNPTFPSTGSGKKIVNPDTAENISEVCTKNPQAAQCF
jgi:uncharacterized protein YggE